MAFLQDLLIFCVCVCACARKKKNGVRDGMVGFLSAREDGHRQRKIVSFVSVYVCTGSDRSPQSTFHRRPQIPPRLSLAFLTLFFLFVQSCLLLYLFLSATSVLALSFSSDCFLLEFNNT